MQLQADKKDPVIKSVLVLSGATHIIAVKKGKWSKTALICVFLLLKTERFLSF